VIKYLKGVGILNIDKRAEERRKRIVANRAAGFAEAEEWDLRYWQSRSPEERLAAFAAIRNDAALIKDGKKTRNSAKRD
jgi:hypothetical protein